MSDLTTHLDLICLSGLFRTARSLLLAESPPLTTGSATASGSGELSGLVFSSDLRFFFHGGVSCVCVCVCVCVHTQEYSS